MSRGGQLKWWGNGYSVRVRFADGTRKWIPLPKGISHKEAEEKARELALAAKQQTSPAAVRAIARPGETFGEWCDRWLEFRERRGLESVRDDRSRLRHHVLPLLAHQQVQAIVAAHLEDVRDAIDGKIAAGEVSWKTGQHIWTVVRSAFRDAWQCKQRDLRVRKDDPTAGLSPPDRGDDKAKQYLYPNEFLQLVSCQEVPLRWRRLFTLATYLLLRAAEIEALGWDDVDLARGVVHVHRSLRRYTREEKPTKTGDTRRFSIEAPVLPLLATLHRERGGKGRVVDAIKMPNKFELSNGLRLYLAVAGVERAELFANDATRKWITFHDLRATGITWMAVRGDDPLKIKQRAGHSSLTTTERYIREAETIRDGFGGVFPRLPDALLGDAAAAAE